jgi:hypothetical protein
MQRSGDTRWWFQKVHTARCCACLFQEQVIKGFGMRVIGAIERGQIAPGGGQ